MLEQLVLVRFNDNWADEMDIVGFQVVTQQEWDDFVKLAHKLRYPSETYFGTNEFNEYDTVEELLACYEVTEITEDQAQTLENLFGPEVRKYGFGHMRMNNNYEDEQ